MLQAHSLLWHYLWLAPGVLQLALAVFLYGRGSHKTYPVFFAWILYDSLDSFIVYALDVLPSVKAETWWFAFLVSVIVGGLINFAVIGELSRQLLRVWPFLAQTANRLLTAVGAVFTLLAALMAAYTVPDNHHWFIGGAQVLQQTLYIIQCGLLLSLFAFAAYFKVAWERSTFGIALGFAIVFSQHLAVWALVTAASLPQHAVALSLLNMATYHVCVVIWIYYLLVPAKTPATSTVSLPENNLAVWNRELERLVQQ